MGDHGTTMATLKMVPDLLDRSGYVKKINRCWNDLPVANVQPNFELSPLVVDNYGSCEKQSRIKEVDNDE